MACLHGEYFEKSQPWDPHQQKGSLVRHLLSAWFFQRTPGPALAQTWLYVMAPIKAGQPRLFKRWLVGQDLNCLPNLAQKCLSFMELKTMETIVSYIKSYHYPPLPVCVQQPGGNLSVALPSFQNCTVFP